MNKTALFISLLLACIFSNEKVQAQNYLEKKINLEVTNQSTEATMFILEKLGGFNFSYDALHLDPSKMVSIEGKQQSLEKILDELFQDRFTYKVIGSHIILRAKNKNAINNSMWILSGVITNTEGNPLENAIVYEVNRQASFITNPDGKYMIQLEGNKLGINFSCKGYQDTVTYVSAQNNRKLDIALKPWQTQTIFKDGSLFTKGINSKSKALDWAYTYKELQDIGVVNLIISDKSLYVSNNLNVQEVRFVQVSLLPSIGTNKLTNGLTTNKLSLNVIAGYSANITGLEIGTVANIIRQEMNGLQISGAVNIAAAKQLDSLQYRGWNGQVSGGINLHGGERINLQVSSAYNQANSVDGIQVSGGINYVRGTTNGLQMSALYNHTEKLRGIQLGFINHADTIEYGFPIGFVNIIKNGYHKWDLSINETFYFNAAYKTGGKNIYSFLKIGAGKYLNAAYGIGYTTKPDRKFSVNLDLSGSALFNTDSDYDTFAGDLYRAQLGLNFKLNKHMTLSTGPSFNFCSPDKKQDEVSNTNLSDRESLFYGNYYLDKAVNSRKNQYWFGWQLGLRF